MSNMGSGCCIGDFTCCVEFHPIRDFIEEIFDCGDCCVGDSSASSESELHAKKVANELAEMKEKMEETTSKSESKIMDDINASMVTFMKEVDWLNDQSFGGEFLNINTKAIRKKEEALKGQVVGCISNVMNRRLVQTDKKLSTILEERNDKKRKENFIKFVDEIKKQALDEFKNKVRKAVKEQSAVISKEIETRQKEVDARLKESIKELTEIMEVKDKGNLEIERKQIDYMYQRSLCDFLLTEVKG